MEKEKEGKKISDLLEQNKSEALKCLFGIARPIYNISAQVRIGAKKMNKFVVFGVD